MNYFHRALTLLARAERQAGCSVLVTFRFRAIQLEESSLEEENSEAGFGSVVWHMKKSALES